MGAVTMTTTGEVLPAARGAVQDWSWALARGLLIGVPLGAGFRAWMRLISTDPEFTWSGTVFIVMIATIAGVGASLARTARQRWHSRWAQGVARTGGTLSVLLLGAGAGTIVLPVWTLAGLAWGRTSWNRWVRVGLLAGSLLFLVGAVVTIGEDFGALGVIRSVASVPTLALIMAVIAWLFTWPTSTMATEPR